MGRSIPYFHCQACGASHDPVTFLARSTEQSLEVAAEILQSRPLAFNGTDITPFLEQAVRTRKWSRFFERFRGDYQNKVLSDRLVTDLRTDTSTLLYDRCLVSLGELLAAFPELRHRIYVGHKDKKNLIIQMEYNVAGAPGRVVIMTPQEAPIDVIRLDHQSPANHLYVATPPPMLRLNWRDHLAVFNNDRTARPLWDWMTEWLAKAGVQTPVAAVTSLVGRPDKADIARITVLPTRTETAWTGAAFAPAMSRVLVCRIREDALKLSAKEVFYPLRSRQEWGCLPTILGDFKALSRNLLDAGQNLTFRSFLEDTMSLDCLSLEEKRLAVESLSQHITVDQRRLMDQVMDEVCSSPPLDLPDSVYTIAGGCYVRRKKITGTESRVTNFRAQILLRMSTRPIWPSGTRKSSSGLVNFLKITTESGIQAYCLADEQLMASSTSLRDRIRAVYADLGEVLPTIYGREPLLGQIIEGTQASGIETCTFPCLGFSHDTNSYNYPEVSFTPLGCERRQLGCGSTVGKIYEKFMASPNTGQAETAFRKFVEGRCLTDERMMNAAALATAAACFFAFKTSRARTGFKFRISDPGLVSLVSRIGGLKVIDPQVLHCNDHLVLPMNNVPVILTGIRLDKFVPFRFYISPPDNFRNSTFDSGVDHGIDLSEEEIDSVPAATFAMFAEAALRSKSPEEVVRNVLTGMPNTFVNHVIHALSSMDSGRSEMELLLEFIASGEGAEFVIGSPDFPDHVFIKKVAVDVFFDTTNTHQVKVRLDRAFRERLGGEFLSSKVRTSDGRVPAWGVPRSFIHSNSNIIKLA
jgi:hypothetical protein